MSGENQKTILLVEDEAITALDEKRILEKYGYEVFTANTGEEAVETITKTPGIDLILMDINLGTGMDGTEAAEIILRERDLPVVFLSAHAEPEIVEKTEKITSYGYVVKDSGPTVLQASIKMAFRLFEAKVREKEKEKALRESLERFEFANHATFNAIWDWNLRTDKLCWNENFQTLFGYSAEEIEPGIESWTHRIHPEDLNRVKTSIHAAIDSGKHSWFDNYRFRRKDGSYASVDDRGYISRDEDGQPVRMIGAMQDITDRKRVEEELIESELKYRSLIECSSDAIFCVDEKGQYQFTNHLFSSTFGKTPEYFIGKTFWDVYPKEHADYRYAATQRVFQTGQSESLEVEVPLPDKTLYFYATANPIKNETGKVILTLTHAVDITERKRVEEELKNSQLLLKSSIESPKDMIILSIDKQYRYLYFNAFHKDVMMNAYGKDVKLGMNLLECITNDDDRMKAQINYDRALAGESHITVEEYGDLDRHFYETRYNPIVDDKNEIIGTTAFSANVTERKMAEETLKESEEKFSVAFKTSPYAITITRLKDGLFIEVNDAFYAMTGYTREEMENNTSIGMGLWVDGKDRSRVVEELLGGGKVAGREFKFKKKNGEILIGLFSAQLIHFNNDTAILSSIDNITERKRAEDQIKALLREKEILLKEVHHRIKNNMSSMMSLLSLQSRAVKNLEAVASLLEAKDRMRSMAVLYDKLYRSENLREMSIKDYLPPLIDEIVRVFPNRDLVKVGKRIDDIVLGVRVISPLGIIVNELITNAMNHAFTGRENGLISVSVSAQAGHVTLIIEDDGNGIPESVDIADSSGFGLQLVAMLTAQIDGTIRIERRKGARFVMEFDA
jgi:PAS domain S-box-containing protein